MKLFSGLISPTTLIETAKETGSYKYVAAAHYYVAMSYLHEGKRAEAREHLQNVVELDMVTDTILNLAAGHLCRMERDMAWPSLRSNISTSEEESSQTVTIRE